MLTFLATLPILVSTNLIDPTFFQVQAHQPFELIACICVLPISCGLFFSISDMFCDIHHQVHLIAQFIHLLDQSMDKPLLYGTGNKLEKLAPKILCCYAHVLLLDHTPRFGVKIFAYDAQMPSSHPY